MKTDSKYTLDVRKSLRSYCLDVQWTFSWFENCSNSSEYVQIHKVLSISVSHGNSEADSLLGEKAPRGSMQSTKTEGTHHESGKPDTQGKFLAVIKIFWHLSKLHLCVSTHVISLQHSHSLVNLNNLLETPNNRYPYFLLPE